MLRRFIPDIGPPRASGNAVEPRHPTPLGKTRRVNLHATRESWRALACFVVAPARKRDTGRIGLAPIVEGFATPPLRDDSRIAVIGDRLQRADGGHATITTLRDAAD